MSSHKTWLKAAAVALAAVALAAPARAVEPDRMVPGDAEAVVSVDVRQLLDSPLIKKYALDQMKAALKQNAEAQQTFQSLGLDPFKDIDTIFVAKGAGGNDNVLIVVRGRFEPDKVQKAAAGFAEKHPDKLKVLKEGTATVYEMKSNKGDGNPAFATFANKHTLVVTPKKEATLKAAANAGAEPATLNKAMKTTLARIPGKQTVWFAVLVTEEMRKAMSKNPMAGELAPKLESVTGSIGVASDVKVAIRVHTTDPKAAAQVKQAINQFKPLLAVVAQSNEELAPLLNDVLDNLKVTTEKDTTSVTLDVTQQMIEKAAKKQ